MMPVSYNGHAINDGVNYQAWFITPVRGLPKLAANVVQRYGTYPRIGGISRGEVVLQILVRRLAGSDDWLRALWSGEDEIPKTLVAVDDDGENARYVQALCLEFNQTTQPGVFVAVLQIDDDVRWRANTPTIVNWTVTGSGQTVMISNGSSGKNDEAYPIIRITPQTYPVGLNSYRRFLAVSWAAGSGATNYPTNITAGTLDTRIASTHFYSAAGNDIRIIVDGTETDYWLHNVNTATTSIWCNLNWQPAQTVSLMTNIGAGAITAVAVNGNIDNFPSTGILQIDNELLTYGGKSDQQFTGITRAAKGSSAAAHSAGATVKWIQHDIWVEYGSTLLPAIAPDNRSKPMFDLATSTNTSWNYLDFFEDGATRAGAWGFVSQTWTMRYGGNRTATANPYGELGISDNTADQTSSRNLNGFWSLFNPCEIVSANFQSGERYYTRSDWWKAYVKSSVTGASIVTNYTLPGGSLDAWVAWSQNVTLVAGAQYVYLWLAGYAKNTKPVRVEVSQVTVALNNTKTPAVTVLPEMNIYRLEATLTNQTTGDAVFVSFGMNTGETLRVDVDRYEAIYETNNSKQFAAVRSVGGIQHRWLRLVPGENTLRWDEPGVVEVDIEIEFERRYYT